MGSGKTPYIRFDRNDYSIPHTHVSRQLTVLATDERVRIVDPETPTELLAEHRRSFDRDQRVEKEDHVRALVEEKRRAHQSRGFDRLFSAAPSTQTMIEKLAERGANLGAATSGLLQLLDRVGADMLERAVADVLRRDQLQLRAVHFAIDKLHYEAGLAPPISVPVTDDVRAKTDIRPHALSNWDRLHSQNDGGPNDDR